MSKKGTGKNAAKIAHNKKNLLEALKKTLGIPTPACEQVGISVRTFYNYYEQDPEFAAAVDEVNQRQGDFVESQLMTDIKNGSTAAIIFYCKTKLKHRGYVERLENQSLDKHGKPTDSNITIAFQDKKD